MIYRLQNWYYRKYQNDMVQTAFVPDFYRRPVWLALRDDILEKYGSICLRCGISGGEEYQDGDDDKGQTAVIHIDHVKPKSIYPWLALCRKNLAPLCDRCNRGKGNRHETDWRRPRRLLIRSLAWCLKRLV